MRLASGFANSNVTQTQIQKFSIDMCDFIRQKTGVYPVLTEDFNNPVLEQGANKTNFREVMNFFKERGWTPGELGKVLALISKMSTFGQ